MKVFGAIAMVFVMLGFVPQSARSSAVQEWIVIEATASAESAAANVALTGNVSLRELAAPGLLGFAVGGNAGHSFLADVLPLDAGSDELRTSGVLGNVHYQVSPTGNDERSVSVGFGVEETAPGSTIAFLVFVTGYEITGDTLNVSSSSGTLTNVVHKGTGTSSLMIGGETDSGPAANIDWIGAGSSMTSASIERGIVGAFHHRACIGPCVFRWQHDDQSGLEVAGRVPVAAFPTEIEIGAGFLGPPGLWTLAEAGVFQSASYGAYAEIGDLWRSFLRP